MHEYVRGKSEVLQPHPPYQQGNSEWDFMKFRLNRLKWKTKEFSDRFIDDVIRVENDLANEHSCRKDARLITKSSE